MMKPSNRPRGFAILSAIFILVVLAVLGAAMMTVSTNQQTGSARDIDGVRAYQAARAGIEWGLYKVQTTTGYRFGYDCPPTDSGAQCPNRRACPVSPSSFQPPEDATTLHGFTVTVTCTGTIDASGGPTVFSLVSTSCNQPHAGNCPNTTDPGSLYVERRLTVSF